MTTQEYEAMLDPRYVADCQWEREEQQREREGQQKREDELLKKVEQLEVEQASGQQMSRRSVQTAGVSEPPLQNSTVIGGENTPSI